MFPYRLGSPFQKGKIKKTSTDVNLAEHSTSKEGGSIPLEVTVSLQEIVEEAKEVEHKE